MRYNFRVQLTIFSILIVQLIASAQTLRTSIGLGALPIASDSICKIPLYLDPDGTFNTTGLQAGDTINHFKLYNVNDQATDILTELQKGKPILLVAGSYTCPVFRGKVNAINSIANKYGSSLSIFIVYVIEPHPDIDTSPYSGNIWTTSANVDAGILYRQPVTYGDRVAIVQDMMSNMTIMHEVLIDGPCNLWWHTFGPASNNAYLIKPDGVVFSKHGWFNKLPLDMSADIDSLLKITSIDEDFLNSEIKVYPNPASSHLNFSFSNVSSGELQLINSLGEIVFQDQIIDQRTYSLQVDDFQRGIYFYNLTGLNNSSIQGKLLIK